MKRLVCILILLTLLTFAFGCNKAPNTGDIVLTISPATTPYTTFDYTGLLTPTPIPNRMDNITYTSEECYEDYGYKFFVCTDSGTYDVTAVEGLVDVEWEIYVLEAEFTQPQRFIAQSYEPVLVGSGTVTVNAGQFVYIYCSVNSFTSSAPAEGATLTMEFIEQ